MSTGVGGRMNGSTHAIQMCFGSGAKATNASGSAGTFQAAPFGAVCVSHVCAHVPRIWATSNTEIGDCGIGALPYVNVSGAILTRVCGRTNGGSHAVQISSGNPVYGTNATTGGTFQAAFFGAVWASHVVAQLVKIGSSSAIASGGAGGG